MSQLVVPVIARLGTTEVQIGVLVLDTDAEPEVRTEPEKVRLAADVLTADVT